MGYKHESAHMLVGWEIGRNGAVCSEQYYRGQKSKEKEQFNAWEGFRDGKAIERASPRRGYLDLSWNRDFIFIYLVILFGIHTRKSHLRRWELHLHMPCLSLGGLACGLVADCTHPVPIPLSAWRTCKYSFRSIQKSPTMVHPQTFPGSPSIFLLPQECLHITISVLVVLCCNLSFFMLVSSVAL